MIIQLHGLLCRDLEPFAVLVDEVEINIGLCAVAVNEVNLDCCDAAVLVDGRTKD